MPVGDDQVKHIEVTRELARSFNNKYGEIFPLPQPLTGVIIQWLMCLPFVHVHVYVVIMY